MFTIKLAAKIMTVVDTTSTGAEADWSGGSAPLARATCNPRLPPFPQPLCLTALVKVGCVFFDRIYHLTSHLTEIIYLIV